MFQLGNVDYVKRTAKLLLFFGLMTIKIKKILATML